MRRSVLFLVVLVLLAACGDGRQRVQLAGGVDLLAGNAIELPAREPLRVKEDARGGHLCLMLRRPFARDRDSIGIRTPEGVLVRPTAVAVRADGGEDSLSRPHLQGIDEICLGPAAGTPLRPPYSAVRLLAPRNISLDRVGWQSSGD